jgi:hypothetical protein
MIKDVVEYGVVWSSWMIFFEIFWVCGAAGSIHGVAERRRHFQLTNSS